MIYLNRFAYSPQGTFGLLTLDDFQCYTIECPWESNRPNVSCIPEGLYKMQKRVSGVVQRTSSFATGWEIQGVTGRSLIMIHVGNTMDDIEGCVALGQNLGTVYGKWAVTPSKPAFVDFMRKMEASGESEPTIRVQFKRAN